MYYYLLIRICDSNARLSSNAINLLELISIAMGSSFKSYIRLYLPGVLSALGDPKVQYDIFIHILIYKMFPYL